jgi:chromosome partitioning protein
MNVVAIGQQKGGVGKSTLAINLACQAFAAGELSAVIDMDAEQGTATRWGKRRKDAPPEVLAADARLLNITLGKLRASGVKWVFLDLPGRSAPIASAGMNASDLVLIPSRPVDVDIEASLTTAQGIVRSEKAYAYLMNVVPQGSAQRARKVLRVLESAGHAVCPVIIQQKMEVPDAIAIGQGVNEAAPKSAAAKEFADLFKWLGEQVKGK